MNERLEIRHINNFRISFIFSWLILTSIIALISVYAYKYFIFLPLTNLLTTIPYSICAMYIYFIINSIYFEIYLYPILNICALNIDNYNPRKEFIDLVIRFIGSGIIYSIIFYIIVIFLFAKEIDILKDVLERYIFNILLSYYIGGFVTLIIFIIFFYVRNKYIRNNKNMNIIEWIEYKYYSFPIKFSLLNFFIIIVLIIIQHLCFYIFRNASVILETISTLSLSIFIFPLNYLITKKIMNKFMNKYDSIINI